MLYYLLLLVSIGFFLAGIRCLVTHTTITKRKRVLISLLASFFSCYSLFFIFSDYITGNGIDDAGVYFLRDTFYDGGVREYGILFFLIILIVTISFIVVNGFLRKAVHPVEGPATRKFMFYLLIILSLILNPTTWGLINYYKSIKKTEVNNSTNPNENRYDVNCFIAHAGGEIGGHIYTNSLEALNLNYEKGFRLFELDIRETSDHKYVAVHDWNNGSK